MDRDFYEVAIKGVIDKWLTYQSVNYLDEYMDWRCETLRLKMNPQEQAFFKVKVQFRKKAGEPMLDFWEGDFNNRQLTTQYEKFGPEVTELPTLLNPALSKEEARQEHFKEMKAKQSAKVKRQTTTKLLKMMTGQ